MGDASLPMAELATLLKEHAAMRDVLEKITRPYRPIRERSRPAGVTQAIALLDAMTEEQDDG